jgi:hypothetical protein
MPKRCSLCACPVQSDLRLPRGRPILIFPVRVIAIAAGRNPSSLPPDNDWAYMRSSVKPIFIRKAMESCRKQDKKPEPVDNCGRDYV